MHKFNECENRTNTNLNVPGLFNEHSESKRNRAACCVSMCFPGREAAGSLLALAAASSTACGAMCGGESDGEVTARACGPSPTVATPRLLRT